jgi:4-amino-4-deoxy-L-arabinose transferase-like glycosyltransferase
MMAGAFSKPLAWRGVIGTLVFLLSAADLTALSRSGPIHVDEAWMLNRGFMVGPLYGAYLRTGVAGPEWDSPLWQPRKPPLGNVIIATGLWLGRIAPPERPYRYDWRHDYEWNVEHRDDVRLPPAAALHAGRSLVPWFAAAATAAVFLLTASAAGTSAGLIAAAIFEWNPVVRLHGSRALSDMVMMGFALWALWYLVRAVAPVWEGTPGRLLRRAFVFGLLTGLAAATKQNGSIVGCAGVVAFAVWGLDSAPRLGLRAALARAALATMAVAAGAFGVFVLVNPQLHRGPIGGSVAQVEAWDEKFREHRGRRPEQALTTVGARARAVGQVLWGHSHGTLPVPHVTGLLTLVGAVLLAVAPASRPRWRAPPRILLLWCAVTTAIVAAWVPLDWDRYFLPVIAVAAVLAGSVALLVPLLRAWLK